MYIGKFAKLTGTTPKTIRLYESIGLLPPAKRNGSYRVYDETYIPTVIQIKQAQKLGFTLNELKAIAKNANIERGFPPEAIIFALSEKRISIERQIKALKEIERSLAKLEAELAESVCFR
ncbi:MerR family transcriptional regulator [Rheinheimera sp. FR7-31]|uniref:MerR family transcriptional regulator n=1 Tax=Rheinheimera fenheensis TaxID=3152295 RepID=UPI00325EC66F